METVLVFKTSVTRIHEVERLRPALDRLVKKNEKWNFDLEDCDRILRVQAWQLLPEHVSAVLAREGYLCEELQD